MTRLLPVLALASTLACATIGKNFDATQLSWLKDGQTSKAEILDHLGPPWRVGSDAGQPTWTYGYYRYRAIGESNSKDLVIRFGPDGKMASYTMNTSFPDERTRLDPSVAAQ